MQKWYFLDEPGNESRRQLGADYKPFMERGDSYRLSASRKWLFRVDVGELQSKLTVCVTGNVPELGSFCPDNVVQLVREDDTDVWAAVVDIPADVEVRYRYCVCLVVDNGIQNIVHSWEPSLAPRCIGLQDASPLMEDEPERYGEYNHSFRVDRGWLTKETIIQLKLFKNPLKIWLPKYAGRNLHIKLTPLNLQNYNSNMPKTMSEALEESLSAETQDLCEVPKHSFTEVANLSEVDPEFENQPQFGKEYRENDSILIQCSVLFPATTAFLLDFYVYSPRISDGEPPHHCGFSYLLPSSLQGSEGSIVIPITSPKQRPLGEVKIEYIIIRPMVNFMCDMALSYARHWKQTRSGLDVGHRGAGNSYNQNMQNCAEVRENTVASLKTAIDHGADFVEFDVQLSKDMVPVIYHDFHVCISLRKKKEIDDGDMLEIPLKDLTFEQLKLLKVYHVSEAKTKNPRFFDEDLEEHQPFPSLQQLFEVLNPHVGFNIEIKWTMQRLDDTFELYHPTDLNLYLDTILEVVLRHAGSRRIIFSCFNPDICSMIRKKQNKYPVMFLTQGETSKWLRYKDPRCWDIKSAVAFANAMEILGVNVHTEDILRDPSQVKLAHESRLVIFCWGDENADPAVIKLLKELGMHGVIYDKIDHYNPKEVKESTFLVEARESQKDLLRLAALQSHDVQNTPSTVQQPQTPKERPLDVDKAREAIEDNASVATDSLESTVTNYKSVNIVNK